MTFNGTSFDLSVLLASIQGLPLDQPHVDLCLLGRQLSYRGGLKAIELQLGIPRRADLWGMSDECRWPEWSCQMERVLITGNGTDSFYSGSVSNAYE